MTDQNPDGNMNEVGDLSRSGTDQIVLLVGRAPGVDRRQVEADGQLWIDRARTTIPKGADVELLGPATGEESQTGLLISSPDVVLLSQWIKSPNASETIRQLRETTGTPVTIITQGGAPLTKFPVSYVVTYTVPVANRPRFQTWQPKIVAAHLDADGFISAEYHAPLTHDERDWTIIVRFATDADLESWRTSARRAELVDELGSMVDNLEVRRAGLTWAGWFPPHSTRTPPRPQRWKQALATLLPLYPTVMLAVTHLAPRLGRDGWGWPSWLVTLATVTIAVTALTWLLMPAVTTILRPWLMPPPDQPIRDSVTWTILVLTACAALLLLFASTT